MTPGSSNPSDPFAFLAEDRKFLKTLAQLARLDPRIRVREDESDLAQQAIINAIEHYGAEGLEQMDAQQRRRLLRTILNNKVVDILRHYHTKTHDVSREQDARARVDESALDWEQNVAAREFTPAEAASRRERFDRVAIAVQSLPEKQQLVVLAIYFLGKPRKEAGELLEMTEGQVIGYLTRGLAQLRVLLSDLESQA